MNIQKLVDSMNLVCKQQRTEVMNTIGKLLLTLKNEEKETVVIGVSSKGDSYRGYYTDFALYPGNTTVEELQVYLEDSILGKTFEGYKGGDYVMDEDTPIWCADYGNCGKPIVAAKNINGDLHIIFGEDDD